MNQCLVTTLKSTVNEDLPKLGILKILVDKDNIPSSNNIIRFIVPSYTEGEKGIFTVYGENNGICVSSTDPTIKSKSEEFGHSAAHQTGMYVVFNNPGYIEISNKYYLDYLEGQTDGLSYNIDDIEYCKHITFIKTSPYSKTTGKLSSISKLVSIDYIDFNNCELITGDLSDIRNLTNLTYLKITGERSKITGNIEYLGNLTKLTEINISNPNYTGDLKRLFDLMYNNGKRSGTLKIYTAQTAMTNNVTYNNTSFSKRVWNVTFTSTGHTETNTDN